MADILKATDRIPSYFSIGTRRFKAGDRYVSRDREMTKVLVETFKYFEREPDLSGLPPLPPSEATRAPEPRKRGRPKGSGSYKRRDMRAEE